MRLLTVATIVVTAASATLATAAIAGGVGITEFVDQGFSSERIIHIQGNKLLSDDEVQAMLPEQRSNIWWWLERKQIEAKLSTHPLVSSATVERCNSFDAECFRVSVTERSAQFLVPMGKKFWVLGEDGALIAAVLPKAINEFKKIMGKDRAPIFIHGLWQPEISEDAVKARLQRLSWALQEIRNARNLTVTRANIQGAAEVELEFQETPVHALVDISGDSKRLVGQLRRFQEILKGFGDQTAQIERIDLAFDRFAVVQRNGQ